MDLIVPDEGVSRNLYIGKCYFLDHIDYTIKKKCYFKALYLSPQTLQSGSTIQDMVVSRIATGTSGPYNQKL